MKISKVGLVQLPALPFGESHAVLVSDVLTFGACMKKMLPGLKRLDAVGDLAGFRGKSVAIEINGTTLIASAHTPVAVDMGDSPNTMLLVVPFAGNHVTHVGRKTFRWAAAQGAMLIPAQARSGECTTCSTLTVALDLHRLQSVARGMVGCANETALDLGLNVPRVLPLQSQGMSFDAVFRHLCGIIDAHIGQPQLPSLAGVDEVLYRTVVVMLRPDLFLPANATSHRVGAASLLHPSRRALDPLISYMQGNLGLAVTLADMERISGLSRRSLQYNFLRRYNSSPILWLRGERLAQAHSRLVHAAADITVSDVALLCGFNNMGVFAKYYQQCFGELPSSTLAQAHNLQVPGDVA